MLFKVKRYVTSSGSLKILKNLSKNRFFYYKLNNFSLRCTCCDRKVNIYKGFSFAKECDYLFFRNYSMDADKISQKLIKDENFTSYHCQCKWLSTKKTMNISNDSNYTWVCGGH